jgi:hypothetical protein
MMDRKICLKHAEFYSKNKFEKLEHFVGFITRIMAAVATKIYLLA